MRRKAAKRLKLVALAVIVTTVVTFWLARHERVRPVPVAKIEKHEAGYKTEDRARLEQLVSEGGRDE